MTNFDVEIRFKSEEEMALANAVAPFLGAVPDKTNSVKGTCFYRYADGELPGLYAYFTECLQLFAALFPDEDMDGDGYAYFEGANVYYSAAYDKTAKTLDVMTGCDVKEGAFFEPLYGEEKTGEEDGCSIYRTQFFIPAALDGELRACLLSIADNAGEAGETLRKRLAQ